MKLKSIEINNFRRLRAAKINLEPAAFILGPNNFGKSSILRAIEVLTSLGDNVDTADFREDDNGDRAAELIIRGTFGPIDALTAASRGFKGRVVDNEFCYQKKWTLGAAKPAIEVKEYPYKIKDAFGSCKTANDLVAAGIAENTVAEVLEITDLNKKLPKNWERMFPEALDFDTSTDPIWVNNPGGIPQNVTSKLPRVIRIPATTDQKDIDSSEKKYILGECLSLLFEDILGQSALTSEIQTKLDELEKEMRPDQEDSLIRILVTEVNNIIRDVFPECGIDITPSLSDLISILKPKYDIALESNVKTSIDRQGTGLVRTTAFAMLRYHANLRLAKEIESRPVIVAFEEPELYLHPCAGNLLRDTIYALGDSDQIICTTHSPWMIDLSRGTQSLSRVVLMNDGHSIGAENYPVSQFLEQLDADDKARVKMLLAFDDEVSRSFFTESQIVVEGDSELVAIRNTIKLLPDTISRKINSRCTVIRGRGKGSLLALVRYLKSLGLTPMVMHDLDTGTPRAEAFNPPIQAAVNNDDNLVTLDTCLEDALGCPVPNSDKPYNAHVVTNGWASHSDVPAAWKNALTKLLSFDWPTE